MSRYFVNCFNTVVNDIGHGTEANQDCVEQPAVDSAEAAAATKCRLREAERTCDRSHHSAPVTKGDVDLPIFVEARVRGSLMVRRAPLALIGEDVRWP